MFLIVIFRNRKNGGNGDDDEAMLKWQFNCLGVLLVQVLFGWGVMRRGR